MKLSQTPIQLSCANDAWVSILSDVLKRGSDETARGLLFKEIIGYGAAFDMTQPLITAKERKLSYKYAYGEAWWILSGKRDVDSIARYNEGIRKYSDDGINFFGAYGPKIAEQIEYIVRTLANDQGSRQATLTIWRPNPSTTKDVPCTVSIQFLIRDGELNCIDTMRSSDTWLGWPYDVFTFACLSTLVLLMLRDSGVTVKLGSLIMQCGSQHVYAHNLDAAKLLCDNYAPSSSDATRLFPQEFVSPTEFLDWLHVRAEQYLNKLSFVDDKQSLRF